MNLPINFSSTLFLYWFGYANIYISVNLTVHAGVLQWTGRKVFNEEK